MADKFDVVVIGGGPGGYAAAIRCAQKKASVALVEKEFMGGTCLNCGCIPSKALLGSVHFMTLAKHAPLMGIKLGSVQPDWPKMQARKDAIIMGFRKGVTGLVRSNGVKIFEGTGIATAPGKVRVDSNSGSTEIEAKSIILATGSVPINIPAFPFDGQTIISSKEALSLGQIPDSLVIIGGGVIGCELACVYVTMGTKVTIIEALDRLLPNEDGWVGAMLEKELKKLGIESMTSKKVTGVQAAGGKAAISLESGESLEAEKVLVAVGRKAICDEETVKALSLKMDSSKVVVNGKMETSAAGVYAIGDAVGTTYLAHGAFAEAEVAADNTLGHEKTMGDYSLVPRAVYTFPEVASVGKNEQKCAEMGIETVVGKAMFKSNGRSIAHNENIGEIRVIRNKANDQIMGVTMVGAIVTELACAARAMIGSKENILDVVFAHPTVSEVLKEAWEDAFGISLHVPPRKM
ncbi:MAG: dihydrolipoyl dehydrogenase [Phycisphaerae bacterium]|nr:dihydrolipoyl dehydrogenase [Phycisphaerae bacterium]